MLISYFSLFIQQGIDFMPYSKIQKFLSSFIIFSLLFSITFRVPFFGDKTYA
jgi:hypothetical protein